MEKKIPAENDIRVEYETSSYLNSPEALEHCDIVENNNVANFVADLRYNGGGNSTL